jgi:hypothetical protein
MTFPRDPAQTSTSGGGPRRSPLGLRTDPVSGAPGASLDTTTTPNPKVNHRRRSQRYV